MPAEREARTARQCAERIRAGAEKLGLGAEAEAWLASRLAILAQFGMLDTPVRWRHWYFQYKPPEDR